MTETVARHVRPNTLDEADVQDLAEELGDSVESLGTSPTVFGLAFNEALMQVQARLVIDPKASELPTWEATVAAMQVSHAAFATTTTNVGTMECRIIDQVRRLPATGPQFYANAGNWLIALWFAIICRDQTRTTELCQIPLTTLRASGAAGDEYIYNWVDTLQTYWLERPGLVDKLATTIDNSYPEVATTAPRDLLQNILYPPIDLFYHFLRKDQDAFNAALLEALQLHKSYWTIDEKRANDLGGTVALALLAITCLACDAGFPITVESDYLPGHLLDREWVGEFEV
ncbi:immunity 49 family protein [Streptomyces sp. NPDC102364]|uniref:immunity 49 family protein n=1 Tax=Streptomyces sp. NPDC102364 TaxID=3366161 RepID=UPI003830DC6A